MTPSSSTVSSDLVQQNEQDIACRTSSNNMICLVEYVPLTEEEQAAVEDIFGIAA